MASDNGLYHIPLDNDGARLLLGTQTASQDRSLLLRYGVSRIVCVGTPAFHKARGAEGGEDSMDNQSETINSGSGSGGRSPSDVGAAGLLYLEIPILDLPSENLLRYLDRSASFIAEGMSRGENVLVNCVYAQSRSATVVAGYMMKHNGLSLAQAVQRIKEAQPTVHINPGFEAQLELYRDLGCRLPGSKATAVVSTPTSLGKVPEATAPSDTDATAWAGPTYRWFAFASRLNKNGGNVYHVTRRSSSASSWGETREEEGGGGGGETGANNRRAKALVYRCKACRAPLFRECNVLDHFHPVVQAASDSVYASFSRHGDGSSWLQARDATTAATAATSSRGQKSKKVVAGAKTRQPGVPEHNNGSTGFAPSGGRGSCTSVFTEPLEWVGITASSAPRAKVTCPGSKGTSECGTKLGAWNLEGADCSCGRTVKPAIQFTLSRVERVRVF